MNIAERMPGYQDQRARGGPVRSTWFCAALAASLWATTTAVGQTVTTYSTAGTFTFTAPVGVTSVTVQAWGGGGGTRTSTSNARGGGGGGAFAQSDVTVIPGNNYTVVVGAGGQASETDANRNGGASWFGSTSTVLAAGGTGGDNAGGAGGTVAASVGTIRYAGGNGGDRGGTGTNGGGGGGGSATPTSNGGNGGNGTSTAGGAAGTGTGAGGAGGAPNNPGNPGNAPGGGGGAHGSSPGTGGSTGAPGQVTVTYTLPPAVNIAFSTPARTVYRTDLAYSATVELQDANGNPAASGTATVIDLSSSLAGTFRNSADDSDITSVSIAAGQSSASFRYRPNVFGDHVLTASDNANVLTAASQTWKALSIYPTASQTYYLPLPEPNILTFLSGINSVAVNPMQRYVGISTVGDAAIIYYDQRENGYEADITNPSSVYSVSNPSGTQIWGDLDPSNGSPPGYPDDYLPSGSTIILNNAINTATQPTIAAPLFHAGDKIGSAKPISITTTVWASGANTLFTDAVEVYDTINWGTEYRVPVGENIAAGDQNAMFERVGASIMAGPGGATVQIDADNNGLFEDTVTLTEGSAHFINSGLQIGARFSSDRPVQVDILTGDVGSTYESRWFRLLPTRLWTDIYYSPVSTPNRSTMDSSPTSGILTSVWLYNPNASAITVTYTRRGGTGLTSNVANKGVAYTSQNLTGTAYGSIYGPIVELNANGTLTGASPEGSWIGIVNRSGTTTAATQAANAETAGAAAIIIVNNTGGTTFWTENVGTTRIIPVVALTQNGGAALRAAGLGAGWVRVSGAQTSSNITVPAGSYARVTMDNGYAGRFSASGGQDFYAVSTTDTTAAAGDNRMWDWGLSLVPDTTLTRQVLIGLGLGRDPTATEQPTENGSPVWVTTMGNGDTDVTVYVDYDADPATGPFVDPNGFRYDLALTMRELEMVKVYNPSGNQSGMLLYTLADGVRLAAAWGQDPQQSSVSRPGLDMGTGIPPLPLFTAIKKSTFIQDNDGDGFPSPGDDIEYQITILNISRVPVPDVTVKDTLPAAVDYLPNTSTFTDENDTVTPIPDNPSPPLFPLTTTYDLLPNASLPVGGAWKVNYKVRIKPFPELPPGTITLINSAIVNSLVIDDPIELDEEDPVYGRIGDFVWYDANANGVQDVGEAGIPNVTVRLYDGSNNLLATTTTDADGSYIFVGLLAGDYRVEFVPPPGYVFGPKYAGGTDLRNENNSDANPGTGSTDVFTLETGEPLTQVDAGLYYGAVIGDRVWLDEDSDGVQDAGEDGIANVRVELRDSGNNLIAFTYTDTNGEYLFTGVPPGVYSVQVVTSSMPAGLAANPTYDEDGTGTPHVSAVTVGIGTVHLTSDFGYNWSSVQDVTNPGPGATGAIGDRIWVDASGDGAQDPGEPGLGGVTVQLYRDSNADGTYDLLVATTTTDAAGNYIFDNLTPGAYEVRVTPPANYTQTGDPDDFGQLATNPDNKTTTPVILAPGDVFVNADFGYQPNAGTFGSIGDRVWFDVNADGVQDGGEPGIQNITVALIRDTNGNGVWDAGEPVIATTITDTNGNYLFTGVPTADGVGTDDYLVWVNDTAGILDLLQPTFDFDGAAPASGVESGFGISAVQNLTPAGTLAHDFGYTAAGQTAPSGLIGDTIFLDYDNSGTPDPGEGISGVTVRLYASDGTTLLRSTVTDDNGNYYFGGLPADGYIVRVDTSTLPNGGAGLTNTVDPDGDVAHESSVSLAAGQINLTQDFGYRPAVPNTIGGTIWEDRNADGLLTDGSGGTSNETGNGIPGVTVVLYDSIGNIVGRTVTDSNGDYEFTNLPDGTYRVDVTDDTNLLAGWWHSTGPNPGQDDNSQSDPYSVTVSGGQTDTTADFGYYVQPAALGNRVWNDTNANGRQDPGEPGIGGAIVRLEIRYPSGVTHVVTTVTDSNGFYSFGNLLLDENQDGVNAGTPEFILSVVNPGNPLYPYHTVQGAPGVPASLNSDAPLGAPAFTRQGQTDVSANPDPSLENASAWTDFGFTITPTLAVITAVRSRIENGVAVISWEVSMELDTVGYHLERQVGGGWVRVNASLIGSNPFEPAPKTYEQADGGAPLGTIQRYRIVEVDGQGRLLRYGPYVLEIGGGEVSYAEWAAGIDWNGADSSPDADPDGDGLTNFQEYLAGTDPLNANLVLKITRIEAMGGGVSLTWNSEPGRIYAVEMALSLNRPFLAVAANLEATPPRNVHIVPVDPVSVRGAFFRVIEQAVRDEESEP